MQNSTEKKKQVDVVGDKKKEIKFDDAIRREFF